MGPPQGTRGRKRPRLEGGGASSAENSSATKSQSASSVSAWSSIGESWLARNIANAFIPLLSLPLVLLLLLLPASLAFKQRLGNKKTTKTFTTVWLIIISIMATLTRPSAGAPGNATTTTTTTTTRVGAVDGTGAATEGPRKMGKCFTALVDADGPDGDLILTPAEYVDAVGRLSGGVVLVGDAEDDSDDSGSNAGVIGDDGVGDFPPSYPAALRGAFAKRAVTARGGTRGVPIVDGDNIIQVADPAEVRRQVGFCREIYDGLLSAFGVGVGRYDCHVALTSGDRVVRDNLLGEDEVGYFLHSLSDGAVGSGGGDGAGDGVAFDSLPQEVVAVYDDFRNREGTLDVRGSKPGEVATVPREQLAMLLDFCKQSAVAVQVYISKEGAASSAAPTATTAVTPAPSSQNAPTLPPTPVPAVTSPPVVGISYVFCLNAIVFGDLNRNSVLERSEYLRFVNRLTGNRYFGVRFGELPPVLQDHYASLAGDFPDGDGNASVEGIDVAGSQPRDVPTLEEKQNLKDVCDSTDSAIQAAIEGEGGGGSTSVTTVVPTTQVPGTLSPTDQSDDDQDTVTATPSPTDASDDGDNDAVSSPPDLPPLPLSRCTRYMYAADTDDDGFLARREYVTFVNLLSPAWFALSFDALPKPLQKHFFDLADDADRIDVRGSSPYEQATPEQQVYLENVCQSTVSVVVEAVASSAPASGDDGPPVSSSVESTVYNAYTVQNTQGFTAHDLQSGPYRDALDDGYRAFVLDQYGDFVESELQQRSMLRGGVRARARQLHPHDEAGTDAGEIKLLSDEIQTYLLVDHPCPSGVTSAYCQQVYGKFKVATYNVAETTTLVGTLGTVVQGSIKDDLQPYIVAANPQVELTVAEAAPLDQVQPPRQTIETPSDGPSSTYIAGSVISVLLAVAFVVGTSLYGYKNRDTLFRRPKLPHLHLFQNLMGTKGATKVLDEEEPPEASNENSNSRNEPDVGDDGKDEAFEMNVEEMIPCVGHQSSGSMDAVGNQSSGSMGTTFFAQFESIISPKRGKRASVSFFGSVEPAESSSSPTTSRGESAGIHSSKQDSSSPGQSLDSSKLKKHDKDIEQGGLPSGLFLSSFSRLADEKGGAAESSAPEMVESDDSSSQSQGSVSDIDLLQDSIPSAPPFLASSSDHRSASSSRDEAQPLRQRYSHRDYYYNAPAQQTYAGRPQHEQKQEISPASFSFEEDMSSADQADKSSRNAPGRYDSAMEALRAMQDVNSLTSVDEDADSDELTEDDIPASFQKSSGVMFSSGLHSEPESEREEETQPEVVVRQSYDDLLLSEGQIRRRILLQGQVESLVREVAPEEVENLSGLMARFSGREKELVQTLQTLRDQKATNSAQQRNAQTTSSEPDGFPILRITALSTAGMGDHSMDETAEDESDSHEDEGTFEDGNRPESEDQEQIHGGSYADGGNDSEDGGDTSYHESHDENHSENEDNGESFWYQSSSVSSNASEGHRSGPSYCGGGSTEESGYLGGGDDDDDDNNDEYGDGGSSRNLSSRKT